MSVDVVVTATAFMDLTFIGLESVPSPGEERFAGDLLRSPGGGAINAIGAARLGLRAALAVPLGEDLEGRFIREALEARGHRARDRRRGSAHADHGRDALGRRARDGHLRARRGHERRGRGRLRAARRRRRARPARPRPAGRARLRDLRRRRRARLRRPPAARPRPRARRVRQPPRVAADHRRVHAGGGRGSSSAPTPRSSSSRSAPTARWRSRTASSCARPASR